MGTKVLCRTGAQEWSAGVIVALLSLLHSTHYQVKLDEGPLILVPVDNDQLCKKLVPPVSIPSVTDFGTRLAAVVLFQQQHHHLPRRRSEDRREQSLANWLKKAKQRKDRSLGSMPSKRQLTPTEAAQLTELLNAPQSSDAAPKDGMHVVENDEQDAGVESDHENENAMVHHSARTKTPRFGRGRGSAWARRWTPTGTHAGPGIAAAGAGSQKGTKRSSFEVIAGLSSRSSVRRRLLRAQHEQKNRNV